MSCMIIIKIWYIRIRNAINVCSYLVLLMCLNLPPWIRCLPGFCVLLGVIPGPKTTNPQAYLQLVADQFDALRDGILVYDAFERKEVCEYT